MDVEVLCELCGDYSNQSAPSREAARGWCVQKGRRAMPEARDTRSQGQGAAGRGRDEQRGTDV